MPDTFCAMLLHVHESGRGTKMQGNDSKKALQHRFPRNIASEMILFIIGRSVN